MNEKKINRASWLGDYFSSSDGHDTMFQTNFKLSGMLGIDKSEIKGLLELDNLEWKRLYRILVTFYTDEIEKSLCSI